MNRYKKSQELLQRALQSIPLGSQTFSKSITQYPLEVSPHFISKGKGSRVWDVDGNEYIDFVNALACVNLGYCDKDVDAAVMEQMKNGVSFTLSHPLEIEVAELLKEFIPCAEMVRFGKNGTDATSAAIRLSRAYTGRDNIAVCGYHGWQDWYISVTTMNLGIPKDVTKLSHKFLYNNIESLKELFNNFPNQIAAVILEPMNVSWPENNFLQEVKDLTHKNGAILIFDETITGFRYSNGGAQEYFNVIPDLATFGKGMANGHPLSAIVGREKIMKEMKNIFFSGTFGGESLSLAAAKAVLIKLRNENVIQKNIGFGNTLINGLSNLIKDEELEKYFRVAGHPSWSFFQILENKEFNVWDIKTLYLQEFFSSGILTLGTHSLSYSHNDSDINYLLSIYKKFFELFKNILTNKNLNSALKCTPIRPLFQVR